MQLLHAHADHKVITVTNLPLRWTAVSSLLLIMVSWLVLFRWTALEVLLRRTIIQAQNCFSDFAKTYLMMTDYYVPCCVKVEDFEGKGYCVKE